MNARNMGGHGKPLIFDRERVELWLREQFWGDFIKKEVEKEKAIDLRQFIDMKVASLQRESEGKTRAAQGKILGRGDRGQAA